TILCLLGAFVVQTSQAGVTPEALEFRRQATRRMIFDRSQEIPLAGLDPAKILGFELMHPPVGVQNGETNFAIEDGRLKLSAEKDASAARWVGGFNPFATYELSLVGIHGDGRVGLLFADSEQNNRLSASIVASGGKYRDPRRGFSIMHARPIGLTGQHEDPHGVYDVEAGKWRLLLSERAGKYRAGMWESDHWDRGYERLAGPVEMDSTGTLIQKIGESRYVFFGSADRKVYIRSYPELEPVGELKIHRPPWNEATGTRIWPNIIPLPDGYPARYIALMMDRQNYPGMPARNWTYGAMYLYHAHVSH
ncbi:MAG: hypothetical protein ACI9VS_004005, partial [Candidatus Binatia bacterium]